MSVNDLVIYKSAVGTAGTLRKNVAAAATAILAGEPVARAQGGVTVTQMADAKPVSGTDFLAGIAMSASTQTASAAGTVEVMPIVPGQVYLANPTTAATWNTQAKYDALVGKRVTLQLSAGVFTINASDSANNGCIIKELNIAETPNKVAFTFDQQVSDDYFKP